MIGSLVTLSLRERLGYGVAEVGASLAYNAINFFLYFFLVNEVGVRPGLAGSVLLLGRVIDAVTDPLMGFLSDRLRSRWGRRTPFIWAGALPLGISFALVWLVPTGSQILSFGVAVGLLALHTVLFTVVQVPYLALTPELAPSYRERTILTSYRVGFGTVASLLAAATPPLIVAHFGGAGRLMHSDPRGWVAMGLIFGAIITSSYVLMALNVREPPAREEEGEAPRAPFRDSISILRVHGFVPITLLFMTVTLGLGIVSSILPFYLDVGLGVDAAGQTLVLGTLFGSAVLALPFWSAFSSRLGKRAAFAMGLGVLSAALLLLVGVSPEEGLSPLLLSVAMLAGVGVSTVLLFPWAMLPDVVEFDDWQNRRRREGLLYAIFTFGQKTAFALGVFLNGRVQEWTGYLPGASLQPERAVWGIRLAVGPVAAVVFLVAFGLVWWFPITEARHETVRRALRRRKGRG